VVLIWIAFLVFILILLALDLGVFHRDAHVVSVREALMWTVIWFATAIAFAGFVYLGHQHHWMGMGLQPDLVERSAAYPDGRVNDAQSALLKFLIGYVVELSLSADNVFVIAMLFTYFAIPRMYQHRVLFWGILGALVMRGAMIAIGARLVAEFAWVLPVFGALLVLTAVKMAFTGEGNSDPGQNFIIRFMRRLWPISDRFHGEHFVVRDEAGARWMLTPLAPALVMVETTDLVFAVDSIPAIFAITADPFLVFTSNVFAILGLRSLYFALAGALHLFHYLKYALAMVLLTVGIKMLAHTWFERVLGEHFNLILLATVILILGTGVLVSLIDLRWHDQIRSAVHRTVHTLGAWAAPDRVVSDLLMEAERKVSANAAAQARAQDARESMPRPSRMTKLWRYFFPGNAGPVLVVAVQGFVEEAGAYAILL
jgi:tellurite resistance protein TerC